MKDADFKGMAKPPIFDTCKKHFEIKSCGYWHPVLTEQLKCAFCEIESLRKEVISIHNSAVESSAILAEVQCRYRNPERCKLEVDPDNEWPYCCVGCATATAIRGLAK